MTVTFRDFRPLQIAPVSLTKIVEGFASHIEPAWEHLQVRGVSMASDEILAGEAFIALKGVNVHAAKFSAEVEQLGAVAIITDTEGADLARSQEVKIPVVEVENPRAAASVMAIRAFDNPAGKMKTVAVTGTNGKTTTCFAVKAAFEAAGLPTMILSTAETRVGDLRIQSARTTFEGPMLQRILAYGVEQGMKAAVVEVSAHALALGRISGMKFDATAFTNLQHDHLDYFHTMENYLAAKARLCSKEFTDYAVICVDDQWGEKLAESSNTNRLTISAYNPASKADWVVTSIVNNVAHAACDFTLSENGDAQAKRSEEIRVALPGEVNVQDAAIAYLMVTGIGISSQAAKAGLAKLAVPGRLEIVGRRGEGTPLVVNDYAHTAEALASILKTMREFTPGKLHLVFGTDGDRDATKRGSLARMAAKYADWLWVTDENPRTEDAQSIRNQLLAGIKEERPAMEGVCEITTCRRDAIRKAILAAAKDDTVIITGKGAEPYQEIEGVYHAYNDTPVAKDCLVAYRNRAHIEA